MPTADKVIIELEARVAKAEADIKRYKATTDKSLKGVEQASERAARKQEAEFKRAARSIKAEQAQIGASMKALAASIATYFTGAELIGLIDGFTRVQNALKVAGLEGSTLKGVQDQLLAQSQRYGVGLEELAKLYGNVSQTAKELGANSQDIINLTEYTAQALKISGTSAVAASGAILGLNQALASARVSVEEFNQMNEGGLRPLLQAAANSEKFGGSVSKLRNYMKETGISGAELFRLINEGSAELEQKSNKAVLTLSGGFQALTSSIMVYVGEADAANGVSAALGQAMVTLSENLDVLADAIAIVSVVLGVKFVAGAVAGSGALRAIAAYASIATTSLAGTALAARSAGSALLGALGGPVGAVIMATALAIGYLVVRETEAEATAKRLAAATAVANEGRDKATKLSQRLASATGRERVEIEKLIQAELRLAKVRQVAALKELTAAKADMQVKVRQAQGAARFAQQVASGEKKGAAGSLMAGSTAKAGVADAQDAVANVGKITEKLEAFNQTVAILSGKDMAGGAAGAPVSAGGGGSKGKAKAGGGESGPSAAEVAMDHAAEMRRLQAEELQAQIQLTDDVREKADLSRQLDDLEYQDRLAQIEQNKAFTKAQKEEQVKALQRLFGRGGEGDLGGLRQAQVNKELDKELRRQETELAQATIEAQTAELELALEGVHGRQDQLAIELRILRLRRDAELAAIENSDLDEKIKEQKRKQLEAETKAAEARARTNAQSPLEQYMTDSEKLFANMNDAFEGVAVSGLEALNDGIVDAIMGAKNLGEVFSNVAKQIIADLLRIAVRMAIFKAIEGAFGGGGFGGGLPGIPGNAMGGSFKVKGNGGTDNNVLSLNGHPIRRVSMGETVSINPSGRGGGAHGGQAIYVDARGAVMNQEFAQMILAQSKRYAADAGAQAVKTANAMAPSVVAANQRYG